MTDTDPGPVVQRILLGAEIRDARERAGLSTSAATKQLGWYTGKLSKVEQGDKGVTDRDLAKLVSVFGIEADRASVLKKLATEARRKLPPARVPEWATKYVNLEAAATEVKIFLADSFPGTVQTVDYARAMLSSAVGTARSEVEPRAEERAARIERLMRGEPTRLWVVVGEEALHREIGGRAVLRGQLEHVRALAGEPNVTVQVVPFDGGAYPSHGVCFTIVTLLEGRPGIVYIEALTGSDYLGREHVRVYDLAYDTLRAAALSPQRTLELLDRRIKELSM
ncbi:helix-turn-helix transcriptional regulator [Haloechinothrix sp. LS1_15]|uniref:helix-turn-helix domain-containing protein n=1 Tax=Haloechinothrix sp. LS1_15 TaxID=2652248 RepID=UPI0029470036|nr:helix-turn-helix transcriptional regulator [Haloechinothrix sp. LS1_15]MDV6011201.1 helix-turn-helix domain-containing protein [Haloechinothrix sp. LS1_15]